MPVKQSWIARIIQPLVLDPFLVVCGRPGRGVPIPLPWRGARQGGVVKPHSLKKSQKSKKDDPILILA